MNDAFTLALPTLALQKLEENPLLVLPASPKTMRRRVEKIGRYFQREFHTDGPPFLASEVPGDLDYIRYEAYLFLEEARARHTEQNPLRYRAVGAACFRWQEWTNAPAGWEFSWVWLHPFSRRRGHLSRAWPAFDSKYGGFHIGQLLSRDMEAFLANRRTDA